MISFALIGCGRIGERHAEHINNKGRLAAVCDNVPEKANKLAKQYGATPYYSLEELLKQKDGIDVAAICTPNGLHAEHEVSGKEYFKDYWSKARHNLVIRPWLYVSFKILS